MEGSKLRIVLPGGSGHVGTLLARHFYEQGHDVTVLSRTPLQEPWRVVPWNPVKSEIVDTWSKVLEGSDICINLAGRSVNCRYTEANKKEIYDSRIGSTRLLNRVIGSLHNPPRLWLNSSTAAIYRHAMDRDMDEATGELGVNEPNLPETWRFPFQVGRDWEEAFFEAHMPGVRKIAMRSAIILSPDRGSIFAELLNLVRRGLGGPVGSGKQLVSWIHAEDFLHAIDWLITHEEFSGAVNLASPNPIPNHDFMREFREAWGMSIGLPASGIVLELGCFLMRTESELVLKSRRAVPMLLKNSDFTFEFPEWQTAVHDLVARWREKYS